MCWGTPAVVVDIDENGMIAKVDFGDGIVHEVFIGIANERISKGDIVIVHAGVIISKFTYEGFVEHIEFLKEVLGEDLQQYINMYNALLSLAKLVKGGKDE
jgi:hydrogenase expression/formation protein HypC